MVVFYEDTVFLYVNEALYCGNAAVIVEVSIKSQENFLTIKINKRNPQKSENLVNELKNDHMELFRFE